MADSIFNADGSGTDEKSLGRRIIQYAARDLVPGLREEGDKQASLVTDVGETTKGLASGLGRQAVDLVKASTYAPAAVSYLVGGGLEAASHATSGLIDSFLDDSKYARKWDNKSFWSDVHQNGVRMWENTNAALDRDDYEFSEHLDDMTDGYFDMLDQDYDSYFRRPAEIAGEWVSPFILAKGATMTARMLKLRSIKGKITKAENEFKKLVPNASTDAMSTARGRKKLLKEANIDARTDIQAKSSLRELRRLETQKSRVQYTVQGEALSNWRLQLRTEVPAVAAAALAIPLIEARFPNQADWLAPLGGIAMSFAAPSTARVLITSPYHAVMVRHYEKKAKKVIGNVAKKSILEDKALNHMLRMDNIYTGDIRDAKGNLIPKFVTREIKESDGSTKKIEVINPELTKRKEQLLATGEYNYRRFEKMARILSDHKDSDAADITYEAMDRYVTLFEKFRLRAIEQGNEDLAESFIPMVHNVLELQGLRGVQATMLNSSSVGWFQRPTNWLFQTELKNDMDSLLTNQRKQISGIRETLLDLRRILGTRPDDPELTNFLDEYQKLKNQVANLKEGNDKLSDKIKILKAEIKNLRTGLIVIEEKARNELGLIKEKETFYQILE